MKLTPQSPAGRAPTLLLGIVGARPAGDIQNPRKYRIIAPTLQPTAGELVFMGQQWCQVYFPTIKPDTSLLRNAYRMAAKNPIPVVQMLKFELLKRLQMTQPV